MFLGKICNCSNFAFPSLLAEVCGLCDLTEKKERKSCIYVLSSDSFGFHGDVFVPLVTIHPAGIKLAAYVNS